jgi:hypothetical protein
MKAEELPRIESRRWEPLLLLFEKERHGATVQGSTARDCLYLVGQRPHW